MKKLELSQWTLAITAINNNKLQVVDSIQPYQDDDEVIIILSQTWNRIQTCVRYINCRVCK